MKYIALLPPSTPASLLIAFLGTLLPSNLKTCVVISNLNQGAT